MRLQPPYARKIHVENRGSDSNPVLSNTKTEAGWSSTNTNANLIFTYRSMYLLTSPILRVSSPLSVVNFICVFWQTNHKDKISQSLFFNFVVLTKNLKGPWKISNLWMTHSSLFGVLQCFSVFVFNPMRSLKLITWLENRLIGRRFLDERV